MQRKIIEIEGEIVSDISYINNKSLNNTINYLNLLIKGKKELNVIENMETGDVYEKIYLKGYKISVTDLDFNSFCIEPKFATTISMEITENELDIIADIRFFFENTLDCLCENLTNKFKNIGFEKDAGGENVIIVELPKPLR